VIKHNISPIIIQATAQNHDSMLLFVQFIAYLTTLCYDSCVVALIFSVSADQLGASYRLLSRQWYIIMVQCC